MKPLRIFRHLASEGPGYFAEYLDAQGIPYELVCIDQGEAVPPGVNDVSGLVFMGGPMSVNDGLPWIVQELALIRRAAETRLPVLGHCLGGQLISKALGGTVTPNPVKEIGWHPVRRVESAAARDWLGDLPAQFEVFHWHGETFSLPLGATPLLTSDYCAEQGFVIGSMLALQCHIEMTEDMVADWVALGQDELKILSSASVQTPAAITRNLPAHIKHLHVVARTLYQRWLHLLDATGTT